MTTLDDLGEPAVPRGRPDLATAEVGGEVVVYDPRSAELHVLNPTAALVWDRCDGAETLGQMIDELSEAFGVPRPTLAADVTALVGRLDGLGLLEDLSPTPAPPPEPSAGSHAHDAERRGSILSFVPPNP